MVALVIIKLKALHFLKKNFSATLSDEDTNESEEEDGFTNAFIIKLKKTDSIAVDEDSAKESENCLLMNSCS